MNSSLLINKSHILLFNNVGVYLYFLRKLHESFGLRLKLGSLSFNSGLVLKVNVCYPQVFNTYKLKVKWSRYRPGVAQTVGRGTALLFHDRGTRRVWVFSNTPRPHFTPGKTLTHFTGGWVGPRAGLDAWKISSPRDSIPDRPARSSIAITTELPGPHV